MLETKLCFLVCKCGEKQFHEVTVYLSGENMTNIWARVWLLCHIYCDSVVDPGCFSGVEGCVLHFPPPGPLHCTPRNYPI